MASMYDPGILGLKSPQKCGCQELLAQGDLIHHGWLRKRGLRNKLPGQFRFFKWPQQYVIITGKCLYYFDSETSKHPAGAISLYGFNRIIRAEDPKMKEVPWAFKLEHIQPDVRSLYFSASSEKEMITWMKAIKTEMFMANNMVNRGVELRRSTERDGESQASSGSFGSSDYKDLESSIYMDPVAPRISSILDDVPHEDVGSDPDEDHEDAADDFRPPLPKRTSSVDKASDAVARGYSLQMLPPPGYSTASEGTDYWKAVYFNGNRVKAAEVINKLAEDGVYLVRKSEDGSNVLVVYTRSGPKKFKIVDMENGQVSLSSTNGPYFDSIEELLYHFYSHNLPNTEDRLITPYRLHPDYK